MSRNVERLDGLALFGSARVGPLSLDVPGLVESRGEGPTGAELELTSLDGPFGTRRLLLSKGGSSLELDIPVLAPEVAGTESGVHPIAEGAIFVHYPFDPGRSEALRSLRPALAVLGNARTLWNEGAPFVEAVRDLRRAVGAGPVLWAPRVGLPHRLPFLAYVGVDLVDTTEGLIRATRGDYFDTTLGVSDRESARRERACDCGACRAEPVGPLAEHVRAAYRRSMAETRAAVRAGRLRELVEARLTAEPALAEMLRYADRELALTLEERTSVTSSVSRTYVTTEALRRPEMLRFRARLLERYRPPPAKSVLLLVPCSKTKPYRFSRSHRRFASAIEGLAGAERVHVVSVSSPIGLVPRELEDVYPARHYDIPVTGDWSEHERGAVLAALDHLLRTGQYSAIVAHLDPEEYRFVHDRLPSDGRVRSSLSDHRSTSSEAIARLRAALVDALAPLSPVPGGPLSVVRQELEEVASFQFGRSAAERLFRPPVRLAGRPWFQRLTDGKVDLATVREERGLFHLTVAGARKIGPPFPLAVEVDPALPLTGDLFTPGVRSADPGIRTGDSVVLLRQGALAAVGEAARPGPLMTELERGLAVHVRHREHRPTDTPMLAERSPTEDGPVVQR